jgi:hypothetical protein
MHPAADPAVTRRTAMNRTLRRCATLLALAASLAAAGCRQEPAPAPPPPSTTGQVPAPSPAPTPPSATASVSVTAVAVGNRIDAEGRAVADGAAFAASDTITAVVTTATSDPNANVPGRLGVRWLFEDDQVVNEELRAFDFTGSGTTRFEVSHPEGWPPGRYRLEVSLDGRVVRTEEFEIR